MHRGAIRGVFLFAAVRPGFLLALDIPPMPKRQIIHNFATRSALLIVSIGVFYGPGAVAALIQVDSSLGAYDPNSCTLVNAFGAASDGQPIGTCPAGDGDDVIELPQNTTVTLTGASIDYGGSLLPSVQRTLLLVGNGSTVASEYTTCGNTPHHRLMSVSPGAMLYVNDITLENGCANDTFDGGAIFASGSLSLENVTFHNNISTWRGGAVAASGDTLQISNSTFSGNFASLDGGAAYATAAQSIVTGSYFAYNTTTGNGGALWVGRFGFKVNNSTFIRNLANTGGAIDAGTGSISFSTFMGNDASIGAAVSGEAASPGTVLANNIFVEAAGGQPGQAYNCGAAFDAVMTFLDTNISDDPSCGGLIFVPTELALAFGAPGLYGGTSNSLPLGNGSVAIGAGAPCSDADGVPEYVDQRGSQRPYGQCDAGAFEHDANAYPVVTSPPLGAGNVLISNGTYLSEYSRAGVHVRDFWPALRPPFPSFIEAVEGDGLTAFGVFFAGYNGNTFGHYLVTGDLWDKRGFTNWADYNGAAVNKIAHSGNRWFLTALVSNIEAGVLVVENGVQVGWLHPNQQIVDLKMGLDGYLYVLLGATIQKFDPNTLNSVATVDLSRSLNGNYAGSIAVGRTGELFVYRSDGKLLKLDAQTNLIASTDCVVSGNTIPCNNIQEIALSQDHTLFLVPQLGYGPPITATVVLIDDAFSSGSNFPVDIPYGGANGPPRLVVSPLLTDEIFADGFGG